MAWWLFRAAWVIPVCFALLAAGLIWLRPAVVFDPPGLLLVLNTVFVTILPLVVAVVAARVYLERGLVSVLFVGAAMVALAGTGTLPAVLLSTLGANSAVAMHNTAFLLSAMFQFAAALTTTGIIPMQLPGKARVHLVVTYGAVIAVVGIVLGVILAGGMPTFFVQGEGPTQLRQAVLVVALCLFVLAASFWWQTYMKVRMASLRWFYLALLLFAIAIVPLLAQASVGNPLSWVGRFAQYAAVLYVFAAVLGVLGVEGDGIGHRFTAAVLQTALPYRPLVDSSTDAIAAVDDNGRLLYGNDAAHRMFGIGGDALGEDFGGLIAAGADQERLHSRVRLHHAAQVDGTSSMTIAASRHDGRRFPAEVAFFSNELAGREITVCVVRDITERRMSEELFTAVFDGSFLGMALVDLRPGRVGCFLRLNPAACTIVGRTEAELLTLRTADLTLPEHLPTEQENLRRLVSGEITESRREKQIIRGDGTTIWIDVSASVAVDADGRPNMLISHVEDITARKDYEAELARQAVSDSLTGLPNRVLLMDRMHQALTSLRRNPGRVAVLYVDLDLFKVINDSAGHDIGDQVLVEVGRRLTDGLRAHDTAARIGGDEFVMVCSKPGDDEAIKRLAARVTTMLAEPVECNGRLVHASASIGVAVTGSADLPAEELLHEADAAMYEAKRRGGHCYAIHDDHEAYEHAVVRRSRVLEDLDRAFTHDWFRLHYQPVVDLVTGEIVGAEALLRIQHPTRGLLLPADFIDIAEGTDFMLPIGDWVVDQACRQLRQWRELRDLRVAINISSRQASSPGLPQRISGALGSNGLPPSSLSLELTERVLLAATLADQGVGIAIDDFGTGYSSLTYLQRFPVDTLKIDKSFVAHLSEDDRDEAITASIIGLGASLGLTVVAEGVETQAQVDTLLRLGCSRAQGYHLGRPQEALALTTLLESDASPTWLAGTREAPTEETGTGSLPHPTKPRAATE